MNNHIIIFIISFVVLFLLLFSIRYYLEKRNENNLKKILEDNFRKAYIEEKKIIDQTPIDQTPIDKEYNSNSSSKDSDTKIISSTPLSQSKNIYYKDDNNWKYTNDDNDYECLINWDYYESDKKTLIASNIPRTTNIEKNNKWCATKNNTLPTDRIIPESKLQDIVDKYMTTAIGAGITGTAEMAIKTAESLAKEAAEKAGQEAVEKAGKEAAEKAGEKAGREAAEKAGQEAAEKIAEEAAEKIAKEAAEKIAKEAAENIAKEAAENIAKEAIENIGKEAIKLLNPKIFSKIAFNMQAKELLSISKTLVKSKTAIKNAVKNLGKMAGKLSARVGAKASLNFAKLAKSLKPSPLTVFDMFSAALDIADVGGYGKMQTKAPLYKLKSDIDKNFKKVMFDAFKKTYEENDIPFNEDDIIWPLIFNPLDEVEDNIQTLIQDTINSIISDHDNPLSKPFHDAISNDIKSGKLTLEDLNNESIINQYIDLLDIDSIIKKINNKRCLDNNGIIYDDDKCTLSEDKCTIWPVPKDNDGNPTIAYREFKNGKCVIADSTMRETCDEMKLKYDINTGMCIIDEAYCKMKGAEWAPNKNIGNEYDCSIPIGQGVAEAIFGTTISRGLKQVFDQDQWVRCGYDGRIKTSTGNCASLQKMDDGTLLELGNCEDNKIQKFYYNTGDNTISSINNFEKCWNPKGDKTDINTQIEIRKCNENKLQKFDYNEKTKKIMLNSDNTKCLDISDDNKNIIISNCSNRNTQEFNMEQIGIDEAAFTCTQPATRSADCPPRYKNIGLTCWRDADSINVGAGRPADCPSGYTNNGIACGRGADSINAGAGRPGDCPSGYINTGLTCLRNADSINVGAGRVADCPNGFKNMGASCYKAWPPKSISMDNMTCNSDEFRTLGRCYKNCPDGYHNTGSSCYRGPDTKGASSMTCNSDEFLNENLGRCYKKCPDGYSNTGSSCYKGPDTKGASSMTCYSDEFLNENLGRCYKKCPDGYSNTGSACYIGPDSKGPSSMTCKENETLYNIVGKVLCVNPGKKCYPGYTNILAACTKKKERKYKFSTQNN